MNEIRRQVEALATAQGQPIVKPVELERQVEALSAADNALREIVNFGTELPQDISEAVFHKAMQIYEEQRRVDMRALAQELGISRRTLYRKVRDRNHLIGEIHWFNARLIFAQALLATRELRGVKRIVAVYKAFIEAVADAPPLKHALREEPETTLRLITTKEGPVHAGVVRIINALLSYERDRGEFETDLPLDALTFALVRIGESYLYADVLTGEQADLAFSVEMVSRLLQPPRVPVAA